MLETTTRAFGSPLTYIQGPGEFDNMETYTKTYSDRVFFLIDGFLFVDFAKRIKRIYEGSSSVYETLSFGGECSRAEIARVVEKVKAFQAGILVGVGGGKTLDTVKMVANELSLPYFIVPTSAATDAPVSGLAIIYTEEGVHDGAVVLKKSSEMVLVDTEIIAKAPIRLFKAGIADALATWFEAQTNERTDHKNCIGKGYRRTKAGMAIAKMAFDVLMEDGKKSIRDISLGALTEAVENVIEANTLLSGLGFQNTGCSVAHAIHAGLTELPETHKYMHGEKVAFGIVCGFTFENTPKEVYDPVMKFMVEMGLPVTLRELDVEPTEENARKIANKVVFRNAIIYSEPYVVTDDTVTYAVLSANALGEEYLRKYKES